MREQIEHLESLMANSKNLRKNIEHPIRSLTVEFNSLIELRKTLAKRYEESIAPFAADFKVIELLELNTEYAQIE
jgi:hypothetical protein